MHEIIQTSVMITVFVMLMMLIIEYINIQTSGQWSKPLKDKRWLQILMASLMGAVPGCLGVYTVVSLFTHKIVSFGALVAAMIATSGDEAFVMFAMMPEQAVWVTLIIFGLAIVAGFLTDAIYKNVSFSEEHDHHFHIHKAENKCDCFNTGIIINNLKTISFTRTLLLTGLVLFSINLFIGSDSHNHSFSINKEVFSKPAFSEKTVDPQEYEKDFLLSEQQHQHDDTELHSNNELEHQLNFPKIIFIIMSIFALFILITVPNHFIEEHVWNHVIKKHFLKIFFWTFGTLLSIYLVKNYLDLDILNLAEDNLWIILFLAIVIGIIPESGPHMVFISLFVAGVIPISILLASSVVQDGHGSLPLFAENKKAFIHMKFINMFMGALIGTIGLLWGF